MQSRYTRYPSGTPDRKNNGTSNRSQNEDMYTARNDSPLGKTDWRSPKSPTIDVSNRIIEVTTISPSTTSEKNKPIMIYDNFIDLTSYGSGEQQQQQHNQQQKKQQPQHPQIKIEHQPYSTSSPSDFVPSGHGSNGTSRAGNQYRDPVSRLYETTILIDDNERNDNIDADVRRFSQEQERDRPNQSYSSSEDAYPFEVDVTIGRSPRSMAASYSKSRVTRNTAFTTAIDVDTEIYDDSSLANVHRRALSPQRSLSLAEHSNGHHSQTTNGSITGSLEYGGALGRAGVAKYGLIAEPLPGMISRSSSMHSSAAVIVPTSYKSKSSYIHMHRMDSDQSFDGREHPGQLREVFDSQSESKIFEADSTTESMGRDDQVQHILAISTSDDVSKHRWNSNRLGFMKSSLSSEASMTDFRKGDFGNGIFRNESLASSSHPLKQRNSFYTRRTIFEIDDKSLDIDSIGILEAVEQTVNTDASLAGYSAVDTKLLDRLSNVYYDNDGVFEDNTDMAHLDKDSDDDMLSQIAIRSSKPSSIRPKPKVFSFDTRDEKPTRTLEGRRESEIIFVDDSLTQHRLPSEIVKLRLGTNDDTADWVPNNSNSDWLINSNKSRNSDTENRRLADGFVIETSPREHTKAVTPVASPRHKNSASESTSRSQGVTSPKNSSPRTLLGNQTIRSQSSSPRHQSRSTISASLTASINEIGSPQKLLSRSPPASPITRTRSRSYSPPQKQNAVPVGQARSPSPQRSQSLLRSPNKFPNDEDHRLNAFWGNKGSKQDPLEIISVDSITRDVSRSIAQEINQSIDFSRQEDNEQPVDAETYYLELQNGKGNANTTDHLVDLSLMTARPEAKEQNDERTKLSDARERNRKSDPPENLTMSKPVPYVSRKSTSPRHNTVRDSYLLQNLVDREVPYRATGQGSAQGETKETLSNEDPYDAEADYQVIKQKREQESMESQQNQKSPNQRFSDTNLIEKASRQEDGNANLLDENSGMSNKDDFESKDSLQSTQDDEGGTAETHDPETISQTSDSNEHQTTDLTNVDVDSNSMQNSEIERGSVSESPADRSEQLEKESMANSPSKKEPLDPPVQNASSSESNLVMAPSTPIHFSFSPREDFQAMLNGSSTDQDKSFNLDEKLRNAAYSLLGSETSINNGSCTGDAEEVQSDMVEAATAVISAVTADVVSALSAGDDMNGRAGPEIISPRSAPSVNSGKTPQVAEPVVQNHTQALIEHAAADLARRQRKAAQRQATPKVEVTKPLVERTSPPSSPKSACTTRTPAVDELRLEESEQSRAIEIAKPGESTLAALASLRKVLSSNDSMSQPSDVVEETKSASDTIGKGFGDGGQNIVSEEGKRVDERSHTSNQHSPKTPSTEIYREPIHQDNPLKTVLSAKSNATAKSRDGSRMSSFDRRNETNNEQDSATTTHGRNVSSDTKKNSKSFLNIDNITTSNLVQTMSNEKSPVNQETAQVDKVDPYAHSRTGSNNFGYYNYKPTRSADSTDTGNVTNSISKYTMSRSETNGSDNNDDATDSKVSIVDTLTTDSDVEPEVYDACSVPYAFQLLDKTCAWLESEDVLFCGYRSKPSLLTKVKQYGTSRRKSKSVNRHAERYANRAHVFLRKSRHEATENESRPAETRREADLEKQSIAQPSLERNPADAEVKKVSPYARPRRQPKKTDSRLKSRTESEHEENSAYLQQRENQASNKQTPVVETPSPQATGTMLRKYMIERMDEKTQKQGVRHVSSRDDGGMIRSHKSNDSSTIFSLSLSMSGKNDNHASETRQQTDLQNEELPKSACQVGNNQANINSDKVHQVLSNASSTDRIVSVYSEPPRPPANTNPVTTTSDVQEATDEGDDAVDFRDESFESQPSKISAPASVESESRIAPPEHVITEHKGAASFTTSAVTEDDFMNRKTTDQKEINSRVSEEDANDFVQLSREQIANNNNAETNSLNMSSTNETEKSDVANTNETLVNETDQMTMDDSNLGECVTEDEKHDPSAPLSPAATLSPISKLSLASSLDVATSVRTGFEYRSPPRPEQFPRDDHPDSHKAWMDQTAPVKPLDLPFSPYLGGNADYDSTAGMKIARSPQDEERMEALHLAEKLRRRAAALKLRRKNRMKRSLHPYDMNSEGRTSPTQSIESYPESPRYGTVDP